MVLRRIIGVLYALMNAAKEAMSRAYVPYSNFQVGAALLDDEGHVHYGCNVENAAYSPTNCAERTALFRAVADGKRPGQFQAIAVIGRYGWSNCAMRRLPPSTS